MSDRHASYPTNSKDNDRLYLDEFTTIPDGAFVQGFIMLVSYVDPDGKNCWGMRHLFDIPTTQAVGLMEVAKIELMANTPNLITNLSIKEDE